MIISCDNPLAIKHGWDNPDKWKFKENIIYSVFKPTTTEDMTEHQISTIRNGDANFNRNRDRLVILGVSEYGHSN